jgi:FMN phosphatase YigB (HAD superfamily)
MSSTQIHTVLFDFGNVLSRFNHFQACQRLAPVLGVPAVELNHVFFLTNLLTERQTGRMSGRAFYELILQRYAISKQELDFPAFAAAWGDIFTPAPAALLDVLQRVLPTVRIAVGSNTEELHWRYASSDPAIQFLTNRSGTMVFTSYGLGYEKPSEQFFLEAAAQGDFSCAGTLFIDDQPENITAFKKIGGQGEVFNLTWQPLDKLERLLTHHGVLH